MLHQVGNRADVEHGHTGTARRFWGTFSSLLGGPAGRQLSGLAPPGLQASVLERDSQRPRLLWAGGKVGADCITSTSREAGRAAEADCR